MAYQQQPQGNYPPPPPVPPHPQQQYQQHPQQPQYSSPPPHGAPQYQQPHQQQPPQQQQQQQLQHQGSHHVPQPPAQAAAPLHPSDNGAFHGGTYSVTHRDTNAVLTVDLQQGANIRSKPGAMIHMSGSVQLTGKVKFSMKKLFTGGDMAESTYVGPGRVALGPTLFGDIISLHVDGRQPWTIGKDAFLACTADVVRETKAQGFSKSMFSGEDIFVYRLAGQGLIWLTSFGAVDRLDLRPGEQHIVDNGHLVAWSCEYRIEKAGGGSMTGLKTGEGLVCRFTGPGSVYVQTRNKDEFDSYIAANSRSSVDMCFQLVELFTSCKCIYYKHAIDRCYAYGFPQHQTTQRHIYVGYACSQHSISLGVNDDSISRREPASIPVEKNFPPSLVLDRESTQEAVNISSYAASDFDTEPVFSIAPSSAETGITVPDPALVDELFHRLLNYHDLKHLWPQVIELSAVDSRVTLSRFIRRFGQDLSKQASASLEHQASKIVQKRAIDVASRIVEAWLPEMTTIAEQKRNLEDRIALEIEPVSDEPGDVADVPFDHRLVHEFLFETPQIDYLENNVKAWVLRAQPPLRWNIFRLTDVVRSYGESRCGFVISDKYVELRAGAIDEFKAQLSGMYGELAEAPTMVEQGGIQDALQNASRTSSIKVLWNSLKFTQTSTHNNLPSHSKSNLLNGDLFACPPSTNLSQILHNYLLLCHPFMRWATKLRQEEVCRIRSDQVFFTLLRECYKDSGQRRAWPWFLRVNAINFVRFEVFRNALVDVQQKPSLPTAAHENEYLFERSASDALSPPIGPNMLMHYFEHPEHADIVPVLFRRVPKRLRNKLTACPVKGSSAVELSKSLFLPL
ncbi:hypothetical protein HJFPF1_10875 [Paramyrothecium foliicola]|nr:hypothetical protein HJFPF1_10875 [Paramyrothecium foliicola]